MVADEYAGPQRFPTTSWSLVALAARSGEPNAREALGQLLECYLPALRAHLVYSKRLTPERADDLIQDFITGKVLERDLIARADRELGKFRTYLLTALDRFLINRIRDAAAKKRATGEGAQALGDHAEDLASPAEPSTAYDLAWARSVLGEVLQRMRTHCADTGRADVWGVFEARVVTPILQGDAPASYEQLIEQFGFQSPSQATNVLATGKRMYARILRSVVGEYARDDREIDEEIGELRRILASSKSRG